LPFVGENHERVSCGGFWVDKFALLPSTFLSH
jgi:hypothetical protein